MLRLHIHIGSLAGACDANTLAVLDIGYLYKADVATFACLLTTKGAGDRGPEYVSNYARWSASRWDLVARALCQCVHRQAAPRTVAESVARPAFADRLCAVLTDVDSTGSVGRGMGSLEITRVKGSRRQYTAVLREDAMPVVRVPAFNHGPAALSAPDLVMRAINWALHHCEVPGPKPRPWLPPLIHKDGKDHVRLLDIPEPARTALMRHCELPLHARLEVPTHDPVLVDAEDVANFLEQA
jgi:hypothetical protein